MRIVDYAVIPSIKAFPNIPFSTAIGALVGFAIACAFIIAMELKDTLIHSEQYLMQTYTMPVLAVLPNTLGAKGRHENNAYKKQKVSDKDIYSQERQEAIGENLDLATAEAYKLLRTNILSSMDDKNGYKIIGVTSALRGEGKSAMAINLSYAMAQMGKRTLLIDADMRMPLIASMLRIKSA